MYKSGEIFNRTARLLGPESMDRIGRSRVIIFGIGGVGSWAAEALVRTGVGHLTLVDADRVAVTNINRQDEATVLTVGDVKVEAMARRLREINPDVSLDLLEKRYSAETAPDFDLESYDFVIDAIDSLADKATLIRNMSETQRPGLASSMGAALRLDATRVKVAEFWKVQGCPLAAALRSRFRKNGIKLLRKVDCVYSDEPPAANLGPVAEEDTAMSYGKAAVNGSLCHITATFGMNLAGLAIRHILSTGN